MLFEAQSLFIYPLLSPKKFHGSLLDKECLLEFALQPICSIVKLTWSISFDWAMVCCTMYSKLTPTSSTTLNWQNLHQAYHAKCKTQQIDGIVH
jgi:hypothetical protein